MLALYRAGRQAEALRAYSEIRDTSTSSLRTSVAIFDATGCPDPPT